MSERARATEYRPGTTPPTKSALLPASSLATCDLVSQLLGWCLGDAQYLPHGRLQAGDHHSSSTRPGTTSLTGRTMPVCRSPRPLARSAPPHPLLLAVATSGLSGDFRAGKAACRRDHQD